MHLLTDNDIFIFLMQTFLLLAAARGLGELFRRIRQPALTAEIIVGLVLGPTILGRVLPGAYNFLFPAGGYQMGMLETVAWLGVFFLLLETGLEIDFSAAWRYRGEALKIALADLIVPMAIAFVFCFYFIPDSFLIQPERRFIFSLFMALVMSISAMPTAARALTDLSLIKTDLGFMIMSALSVNDIVGWLTFSVIFAWFSSQSLDIFRITGLFFFAVGMVVIGLKFGRKFADTVISRIRRARLPETGASLTFLCLLGLLCGAIFHRIGMHALFGFFLAGVMAGEARALPERTRQVISQMVYAIFVPLFFASIGLRLDFAQNFQLPLVAGVLLVSVTGKFLGAWLGASLARLPASNRMPVAAAHISGGSMEIVIAATAMQAGLISAAVFVAIIFSAMFSAMLMGPLLSYYLRQRKEIGVLEFFSRRAIVPRISAADRDSAIAQLSVVAAEQPGMPGSEHIYQAVIERENKMGTAVEEGIAIPHARLAGLGKTLVVFGRSHEGIEWDSPDGKPSRLIFLILTDSADDNAQIQILRAVSRLGVDPAAREALAAVNPEKESWDILQSVLASKKVVKK